MKLMHNVHLAALRYAAAYERFHEAVLGLPISVGRPKVAYVPPRRIEVWGVLYDKSAQQMVEFFDSMAAKYNKLADEVPDYQFALRPEVWVFPKQAQTEK